MIIVDTSVLINLFREKPTLAVRKFFRVEQEGLEFAIPAICIQEILQGAKDESEWKTLDIYLCSQNILYPKDSLMTHKESARIYYDLRRKGLTIHSTIDCFIAQLVLENEGYRLLHDDKDFLNIQKVRPLDFF